MNSLDLVVELLYAAYEEKYRREDFDRNDKSTESFKKLQAMLNHEQAKELLNFYDLNFEFLILSRKHVFRYIMLLLFPDGEWGE